MTTTIVGEPAAAAELARQDPEHTRIWAFEPAAAVAEAGSSAGLAEALARFEADVSGQQPGQVVLADDSELALAAALVATKLLIPLAAVPAARLQSTANGRLIAQLAPAYTRSA